MNRGNHRLATPLDGGKVVLQGENVPAQGFGAAGRLQLLAVGSGQHLKIDTRAEVWAMSGQDNHPRLRLGIQPLETRLQFAPHRGAHGVGLVAAIEEHFGNVVLQAQFQRVEGGLSGGFSWHGLRRGLRYGLRHGWLPVSAQSAKGLDSLSEARASPIRSVSAVKATDSSPSTE